MIDRDLFESIVSQLLNEIETLTRDRDNLSKDRQALQNENVRLSDQNWRLEQQQLQQLAEVDTTTFAEEPPS